MAKGSPVILMPQVPDYLIEMHYKEKPSLLPSPTTCNVTFCFMACRILRPSKNNELHKHNTSGEIALKCNFRNNYLKTLLNEKARWKDETNIPFVFSRFLIHMEVQWNVQMVRGKRKHELRETRLNGFAKLTHIRSLVSLLRKLTLFPLYLLLWLCLNSKPTSLDKLSGEIHSFYSRLTCFSSGACYSNAWSWSKLHLSGV